MGENKTINLSDLNLREKIGQLIFIKPQGKRIEYLKELNIGGIFLDKKSGSKKSDFKKRLIFIGKILI